jgi:hypothetical protein
MSRGFFDNILGKGNSDQVIDGFWHHATSVSGAIRIFFYFAGSLSFGGIYLFPLTATDAAIPTLWLWGALLGIPLVWLAVSRLIAKVNDDLDAGEKRSAFWFGVLREINNLKNSIAPSIAAQAQSTVTPTVDAPAQVTVPWHPLVSNQCVGLGQLYYLRDFIKNQEGLVVNGYRVSFRSLTYANPGQAAPETLINNPSSIDSQALYVVQSIQISIQKVGAQGAAVDAGGIDALEEDAAVGNKTPLSGEEKNRLRLKRFMNIIAISAGFLYVQECFNFWAQTNPYSIFAYTFLIFTSVALAWHQHQTKQKSAQASDASSLGRQDRRALMNNVVKALGIALLSSALYLLPSLLPAVAANAGFDFIFKALSFCFFAMAGYRTMIYKNAYEQRLSELRSDTDVHYRALLQADQLKVGHDRSETDCSQPIKGSAKAIKKGHSMGSMLYRFCQFIWEFLRTAFPVAFFLDFFVTTFGGPSIGIVNMDFMSVFKQPPITALVLELTFVALCCGAFAAFMVKDGIKREQQEDYLESKGINIEGTNICRGLDVRQLHEAVVRQDLADLAGSEGSEYSADSKVLQLSL